MKVAVIGCGYVADFYAGNARDYPDVELIGAFDRDPARTRAFCDTFGLRPYGGLDALLADDAVELVLNLTNPRSHDELTRASLEAGKHVYSEKPLAMDRAGAEALAALARERGLRLGCAPCSVLSNKAQTVWRTIRDGAIGTVRLVYASYDDCIMPRMRPWTWTSPSGAPWPAKDEFEIGCAFEHAGYILSWLAAFFGPARRVTGFSSCLLPDKGIALDSVAPDLSVGCLEYDGGVVARVTCGLVAPRDRSLLVVGDDGHLLVNDLRDDAEAVFLRRTPMDGGLGRAERVLNRLSGWTRPLGVALPWPRTPWTLYRRCPDALRGPASRAAPGKPVDFVRGVDEMIEAIAQDRPHRLSAELGVHLVELVEAIQHPERSGHQLVVETTFPPMPPLA